jgi:hypothetical protein
MSWYLNANDILTNADLPQTAIDDLYSSPYPASFWNLTNGRLTLNSEDWQPIPESIDTPILIPPYPASFWYLGEDNQLHMGLLPVSVSDLLFTYPYPASLWWLNEDNLLKLIFLPEAIELPPNGGAFYNAESLEYVRIPKSVTSIGIQAFQGTKLQKVMISKKCKYYLSSFPFGCEVLFYEDQFDQNYQITISGNNSYRFTETITHDEESETSEIP